MTHDNVVFKKGDLVIVNPAGIVSPAFARGARYVGLLLSIFYGPYEIWQVLRQDGHLDTVGSQRLELLKIDCNSDE